LFLTLLRDNAFFLQSTNCLSRDCHGDFLSINNKGFLLKVWLENSLSAAQGKAYVVAVLLAFAGDLAS
jgi:hypothetical protein